jgi:hypothetical protein
MKLLRFDLEVARGIDRYNSAGFHLAKIAHLFDESVIQCAYLTANGVIGYHQATIPQLFLVVRGAGWVRGETLDRTSIETGQAAYWEKGEWHESGTEAGMTAIIIEAMNFDPVKLMPPV